jgi:hypothetical protein
MTAKPQYVIKSTKGFVDSRQANGNP